MKDTKNSTKTFIDIFLIFIIGLIPLLWFRDGYNAIAGFDFAVYLNPVSTLKKSLFLWSDNMAGGYDISHEISSMAYYLLFSLPLLMGVDFYNTEKILFVFLFTLQGWSMYYMLTVIFSDNRNKRAIALFGAIFYMFSFPVMAHFGRGNFAAILTYGLIPFIIALLYRGFTSREKQWKYIFLIVLISFPISATKGHPADFLVLVWVCILFILFHLVTTSREKANHILSFTAKTSFLCLIANLWWIVPNIIYLTDFGLSHEDLVKEGFYDLNILNYYSKGSSLFTLFANKRLDLWFDVPSDLVLNPSIYNKGFFVMIGLIIPIIAYSALFVKRPNRNILFFSILGIIALFLAKGNHDPLGFIFEWMYMNIPGFLFFRAPYRVFSSLVAFSLAPLAGFTLGHILGKKISNHSIWRIFESIRTGPQTWSIDRFDLKNASITLFLTCIVGASLIYVWPLFTGAHLREKGTLREPGVFHKIPGYYFHANMWLKKQGNDFKVYYPTEVYDVNTTWGYNGPDPTFELLSIPKVVSRPNGTVYIRYQRPIESLNRLVWNWQYGELGKTMALFNVRYIIFQHDLNRWVLPFYNFGIYLDSLLQSNGILPKARISPLVFYENKNYLPRIFNATSTYILSGDSMAFPALSLTGLLEKPFMIMIKDVDIGELKDIVHKVDGIIFHNTNTIDTVSMLLMKRYGGKLKDNRYSFVVPRSGVYSIYFLGEIGEGTLMFIDDTLLFYREEFLRTGLRWKKLTDIRLQRGKHLLRIAEPDIRINGKVIVVPLDLFNLVRQKFLSLMNKENFNVIYIIGSEMLRSNSKHHIELQGDTAYKVKTIAVREFFREKVDIFRDDLLTRDWDFKILKGKAKYRVDREKLTVRAQDEETDHFTFRLQRNLPSIDIGEYQEFILETNLNCYMCDNIVIRMNISANNRWITDREVSFKWSKTLNNGINLYELARKEFPDATLFRLNRLIIEGRVSDARLPFYMKKPKMIGRFRVLEKRCNNQKGYAFSIGKIPFFLDGKQCGRWFDQGDLKPGIHAIKKDRVFKGKFIILITKHDHNNGEQRERTHVDFKKINPTRYKGHIISTGKSALVFSDSYNKGWTLYLGDKRYKPIKVNGFANGFLIDERGEYDFSLEYAPQRIYRYSIVVSIASLLIMFFVSGKNFISNNDRSKEK